MRGSSNCRWHCPLRGARCTAPAARRPLRSARCGASERGALHISTRVLRRRLLRGLSDSYYGPHDVDHVVFDSNRCWCARLPSLKELYPGAKIIACVRNVAWVMDSIERLYRANPFENTRLFNDDLERNTVYSRVETLAQGGRLVGYAYSALKEAYYGEHADSLLLVEYELLTQAPDKVMRLVYEFLGERWFEHDFSNVSFDAPAFDQALGLAGLHRVRPVVAPEPRRTVLPPDLFEQYAKLSFWQDSSGSAAHVIRAHDTAPRDAPTTLSPLKFTIPQEPSPGRRA